MKRFPSLLITWSAMAVALVTLLIMGSGTAYAGFFEPCSNLQVENTAPGVTSNISGTFGVGIGADCISRTGDDDKEMSNFGAVVNFLPPEWGVAADAALTDGVKFAELDAEATLGLLNGGCNDKVFPEFEMMDGTTNTANSIDALPPGTKDRLKPLSADANGNGVIDGAEKFPSFLGPDLVHGEDPLFTAEALSMLRARLFGATTVSGVEIILNFMIFEPGVALGEDYDFDIDPALGYPSVTVLQDPSAPASDEDAITDFCAPLATKTIQFGKVGSENFRTNPSDGAYNFLTLTASQFDADGDGIENSLDPCPFDRDDQYGPNKDIAWDPRKQGGQDPGDRDVDQDYGIPFPDGIPDSCDPFPEVPSLYSSGIGIARTDEDKDGWANRVDNCPLNPNVDQDNADEDGIGDACEGVEHGAQCTNAKDDDGDTMVNDGCPKIGNAAESGDDCANSTDDDDDTVVNDGCPTLDAAGAASVNDGHNVVVCFVNTVNIGAGGTAPYTDADLICTEDAVGIDKNHNGIFDSQEGGGPGDGEQTEEEQQDLLKQQLLEDLVVGLNLAVALESLAPGGSTVIGAVCAEQANSLQAVSGAEITFKIKEQPGSDADLDGETEVTKTADAEGFAETTLNVGSTAGEIVVSAVGCGDEKTVTVTVTGGALGEVTGPGDAAGGAATGVGSLAPVVSSIPAWATIVSALGGAGLLGSLGALVARFIRRRP